jgi:hypothetical protein
VDRVFHKFASRTPEGAERLIEAQGASLSDVLKLGCCIGFRGCKWPFVPQMASVLCAFRAVAVSVLKFFEVGLILQRGDTFAELFHFLLLGEGVNTL